MCKEDSFGVDQCSDRVGTCFSGNEEKHQEDQKQGFLNWGAPELPVDLV